MTDDDTVALDPAEVGAWLQLRHFEAELARADQQRLDQLIRTRRQQPNLELINDRLRARGWGKPA